MNKIVFFTVIFIAFILRFYQLGINPPSLDWDEASLGYNAYSILKTGADEYGNKSPLSIRSFDDYKPPLYTYLAIPSVALFGLTEFAVRVPSALLGTLTVIVTYFLVKQLFFATSKSHIPIIAAGLLAISPWHLQFSRVAFEANVGLFFFVFGTLLFLKGLVKKKWLVASFIVFTLAFYAYHSLRLVIPIFLVGLFIYYRKTLWQAKKYLWVGLLCAAILAIPLLGVFLGAAGSSRFSSVTILTPTGTLDHSIAQLQFDNEKGNILGQIFHNRRIVYGIAVIKGYLDHWNFDFLFLHGDGIMRHHAEDMGMLYLFELPFILIGMYLLLAKKTKGAFVIFWWFLVAPIASSITTGTPHPVRALLYLPTFQIFAAFGLASTFSFLNNRKMKLIIGIILLVAVFNFLYYLHQYYVHTPREYSQGWQYGYKQVFEELTKVEGTYDKIIVTYKYDQPYIFHLFYHKIDPSWYQANWNSKGNGTIDRAKRAYGKYEFRNINWGEDQKLVNTLIVGTPDEFPKEVNSILDVLFLDGTVAFRFVKP